MWLAENGMMKFLKKTVDIAPPVVDTTPTAADAVQEKIAYKLTTFD